MASPEALAQAATTAAAAPDKKPGAGTAKHFDQPGVRFSIPELRDLELKRKTESQQGSFRQHVEEGLIALWMNPVTDWDKKNAPPKATLTKWLESVKSGKSSGGGAIAAAKAREDSLRKDIENLKKQLADAKAGKATT